MGIEILLFTWQLSIHRNLERVTPPVLRGKSVGWRLTGGLDHAGSSKKELRQNLKRLRSRCFRFLHSVEEKRKWQAAQVVLSQDEEGVVGCHL